MDKHQYSREVVVLENLQIQMLLYVYTDIFEHVLEPQGLGSAEDPEIVT